MKTLRSDIQAVFDRDPAARSTLEVLFLYPGLHAIWLLPPGACGCGVMASISLGRLDQQLLAGRLTGIEIHPGAQISPALLH